MELIEKTKVFVKKHGMAIAGIAMGAAGVGLVYFIGKSVVTPRTETKVISDLISDLEAKEKERIKALDWKIGEVVSLWEMDTEETLTAVCINDIPIADLGNLGQELCKLENFANNACVSMTVNNQTAVGN